MGPETHLIASVNAESGKLRQRFPKAMDEMSELHRDVYQGLNADRDEALLAGLGPIALGA